MRWCRNRFQKLSIMLVIRMPGWRKFSAAFSIDINVLNSRKLTVYSTGLVASITLIDFSIFIGCNHWYNLITLYFVIFIAKPLYGCPFHAWIVSIVWNISNLNGLVNNLLYIGYIRYGSLQWRVWLKMISSLVAIFYKLGINMGVLASLGSLFGKKSRLRNSHYYLYLNSRFYIAKRLKSPISTTNEHRIEQASPQSSLFS